MWPENALRTAGRCNVMTATPSTTSTSTWSSPTPVSSGAVWFGRASSGTGATLGARRVGETEHAGVVTERAEYDERVEHLVVAEHERPWVRAVQCIDHTAHGVERAARD